ncbi:unnamed protein product [Phytomonas sp. EM1]|nr:unnamed protein product [Phytomonas sp. EM1]|eukprot:CCW61285.1 unnamed protein product [Phytomonas sp. isolate EM1]
MYCKTCDLHIKESFAVYCEDCGGKLEKRAAPEGSKNPESSTESGALPRVTVSRGGGGSSSSAGAAVTPLLNGGKFESEEWAGSGVREPCPSCGRQFAPEVLQKHIRKCASQKKKRPVFNIHKKWIEGLEPVPRRSNGVGDSGRNKAGGGGVVAAPPKKNWKAESEAFRRALREAKQVDQILKSGGNVRDLPPPTYSENPDYVPCPHCQRRFAPKTAERHIPHCAVTINKPKPPPKRRGV